MIGKVFWLWYDESNILLIAIWNIGKYKISKYLSCSKLFVRQCTKYICSQLLTNPYVKKALKLSFPPIVDVEPWLTSKSG